MCAISSQNRCAINNLFSSSACSYNYEKYATPVYRRNTLGTTKHHNITALQGTSIVEEHRILMGMVIEKVQSVKSGLTEACSNLLTGFEVSDAKEIVPI